jgi:hypothetical protein
MARPDTPENSDHARVRELIGREPRGNYSVVVRDSHGDPVVLRNEPLLHDGTPMPTLYWLIGPHEVREVSRIEAEGGVNEVESIIGLERIADIHLRYAKERDADIPSNHTGPRPFGGVGGTRTGVKCLHAHFAWWLAGGDDAIGEWTALQLSARGVTFTERAQ